MRRPYSIFRNTVAEYIRNARHDLRATKGASADRHTVNRLAFARATRAGLPNTAQAIDRSSLRVTRTLAKLRPYDYGLTVTREHATVLQDQRGTKMTRTNHTVRVSRFERDGQLGDDAWALYASTYKSEAEAKRAMKRASAEGYKRVRYIQTRDA